MIDDLERRVRQSGLPEDELFEHAIVVKVETNKNAFLWHFALSDQSS